MRGATLPARGKIARIRDFNPRTPCGVRPFAPEGSIMRFSFQSTHPLRGATILQHTGVNVNSISIHALLAGCDNYLTISWEVSKYFNPRTPCGVRQYWYNLACSWPLISIHAPLAGCDAPLFGSFTVSRDFNPRTPCGVRHRAFGNAHLAAQFQSTHPMRGATA